MDMYPRYQSRSGYFNQDDQTDGYGVDHSGFSLRVELLYQTARTEREQELFENFNRQGVDENYPRLGTGFWENSADNYGFGRSNIENNIKKRQFTPVPDTSIQNAAQKRAMMMPTQSRNDFISSFETKTSDRVKRLYPETSPADPNDQNCSMMFNGSKLELLKDNKTIDILDALSGDKNYQAKKFQNVAYKGPIPEGIYYANQDQRQNIGVSDAIIGLATGILNVNRGKWKGSLPAWGMRRVWLEPDPETNTYGRDGFMIHGGLSKGSAGCIDIPWQTGRLSDFLDGCQESVPVYVRYIRENW